MVEHSDSGSPDPRFKLRRRELPPSRREHLLRIVLRVVTVLLVVVALGDLVLGYFRHAP